MVDNRMFHREILQSSLFYKLGEAFPGHELHAQRLFWTLILMADDYGRGRFIPADIRIRAFASARTAFSEVMLEDIEQWMKEIEDSESAYIYEIGAERYFFLPKWFEYQPVKYRCKSHIPEPSQEFLAEKGLFLDDSGEILPIHPGNSPAAEKKEGKSEKTPIRREENRREENILSPPTGADGSLFGDSGEEQPKPRKHIDEKNARTDVQKVVKFWHVRFKDTYSTPEETIRYSGDAKVMAGQAANLLKQNKLGVIIAAIDYLFDQETTDFLKHDWNHFIRKASEYIPKAMKAGYKWD